MRAAALSFLLLPNCPGLREGESAVPLPCITPIERTGLATGHPGIQDGVIFAILAAVVVVVVVFSYSFPSQETALVAARMSSIVLDETSSSGSSSQASDRQDATGRACCDQSNLRVN